MLSFTIAHLAVIALRVKHPDVERPWRGPGNVAIARSRPAAVRALRRARHRARVVVVTVLNSTSLIAGFVWLAIGIVDLRRLPAPPGPVADRDHQGRRARSRSVEHEVEYESVLVAFEDDRLLAGGGRHRRQAGGAPPARHPRAGRRSPCRPNSPIDAPLPDQERARRSRRSTRRACSAARRVTGHWEKVRPGRRGRRIVEEAREIQRARADHVAAAARRAGGSLFGKTLETVLAERPCRVIIDSSSRSPGAEPAGRRRGVAFDAVERAYRASTRLLSAALRSSWAWRWSRRRSRAAAARCAGRRRWACCSRCSALAGSTAARPASVTLASARAPGAAACVHRARRAKRLPSAPRRDRARARRARAVRDRAQRGRRVDLLLARRGGRPRARADAAGLPGRRRLLRADDDDLRRGRRRCTRSAAALDASRATRSTSSGASSPAGRSCSTT